MARIVVADDAAMVRILVCRSLGRHRTYEAEDGDEALALVQEHRPQIVILDWMMPGLSGVEVCRQIRADPSLADTHIVMMTAKGGFDAAEEARQAGVDDFVTKPIMPRQLANLVDRILAARAGNAARP